MTWRMGGSGEPPYMTDRTAQNEGTEDAQRVATLSDVGRVS